MEYYTVDISTNNTDHKLLVEAKAGYRNEGIGVYEYCGVRGEDIQINFFCEINSALLVSQSGKSRRKIQFEDYAEKISDAVQMQIDAEAERIREYGYED